MKNQNRNIFIIAENNGDRDGFNIYIEYCGNREYVMTHRHSSFMYFLLKNGLRLDDLKRIQGSDGRLCGYPIKKYREKIRYLIRVIDEYISETDYCCA